MPILAPKQYCVGCTACAGICPKQCIKMKKTPDGFAYPDIAHSANCIKCGMCESVCPVLHECVIKTGLPAAYAALSKEESVRMNSSSGGIFTELAKIVISQNGAVYGAAYDEKFEVYHCCVDNADELYRLQGAKYAESCLGNSFIDILDRLKQNQMVLFSGTPCQVAGLKAFVRKDFDNLICVDFVCHGIPSPMAWETYVEYRAKEDAGGKLPYSINMRSKETGWSRYQYSNLFEYEDGKQYSTISSQNLFMKLFVEDYISRPSCADCKFKGYNRVSDITLGDFWGIWDIDPDMDDNKGTSVVLIHSDKGQNLWRDIGSEIKYKEVSLEQTSQQNLSMLVSSKANVNRDAALSRIKEGKIDSCKEFFMAVQKRSVCTRIKEIAKRLLKNNLLI